MAACNTAIIREIEKKALSDPKARDFLQQIKMGYYRVIPEDDQRRYYLYGVNLIALRCFCSISSGVLQFFNPKREISISPETFQYLDTAHQEKLATLIGRLYLLNPPSEVEKKDMKALIQDAHLKQGEAEYAKGWDLITNGSCADISLEKLNLLESERQQQLITLIGKQSLQVLSENEKRLIKDFVEIANLRHANQQRAGLNTVRPNSYTAFRPVAPSIISSVCVSSESLRPS